MIIPIALAASSLFVQQNAFDQRLTVVKSVVRPSGAPDETADVPMRAVPILHRGDRIGVRFPTLGGADWQATVAFYYQGDPLRWQNRYNSADWSDLRKPIGDISLHLVEKAGETPLVILAHEVDSYADRKSLLGALAKGFPTLASTEAQMQATLHETTTLERLANGLMSAYAPGAPTQKIDALNLMAQAADYPLTQDDRSMSPAYWIQFMNVLNTQRASGAPLDAGAFGAALGGSVPPLGKAIIAAGTQLYNLFRAPQRVQAYNFRWMPLYEDGDQYRCVVPPISAGEPAKTVLLSWLPVQNTTDLPTLSMDAKSIRFGDAQVEMHLAGPCAPLLAKPEARSFKLKVGPDGVEYPLKSTGAGLVLDAGSAHALSAKYPGTSVNATVEMQYGLDPVDSAPVSLECAQPYNWSIGDPKAMEQVEAAAPAATVIVSPVAHPGSSSPPRLTKCELACGPEKSPGVPSPMPNGSWSIAFSNLPKGHGPGTIYLYEDGLDKPDAIPVTVYATRPAISKVAVVRGESNCILEGNGVDQIAKLDVAGAAFTRVNGNTFKTADGKPAPAAGNATVTLPDGRSFIYPIVATDPLPRFNVTAQLVGEGKTPGLQLPPNLVSADTVIDISVEANKPILTGTAQYDIKPRVSVAAADHGHVSMRAGATATTAIYHGPIRDFLPANAVGKFDMKVVYDGGASDYIPLTIAVAGKQEEVEVVDLPTVTAFEVLPGKWRLYGTNLEFIRSINVNGQPIPVTRQAAYLEFVGGVPANAEVRLLDSNAAITLSFAGVPWKNPADLSNLLKWLARA